MTSKHPEVHRIIAQIEKPTSRDPAGRVTEGYYTVVRGVMTMTDASGIPMRNANGDMPTLSALVDAALKWCQDNGADWIGVSFNTPNVLSRPFWRGCGFEPTGWKLARRIPPL